MNEEAAEPPPGSVAVLLTAVAVLIVLSMSFSASESAFLSINKLRIRFLRSKKDKKAQRVGKLLDKKENLLNTVLVGNNIVNIAVSSILTSLALSLFGSAGVGVATIAATILLLIFGEILPKTIAVLHPEPVAFFMSPVISFFVFIFKPVVKIFTFISRGIVSLAGVSVSGKQISFTEEEIKTFIEVGEEEGVLESGEKKMLNSVFKFTDLDAKDIMVPRTDIAAVQMNSSYRDILSLSRESHFSRFPVYGEDIDDVQGILYVKDVLFYSGKEEDFSLRRLMRPPLFVLENKTISSVQQILRENNQSIAIVLDEYSGTAGLLTMEDLAEEIFGGISDEYDVPENSAAVQTDGEQAVIDGATRLIDLSERLGISLRSEYYDTIAGYITEKKGDMPVTGDYVDEGGWRFTVAEAEPRRIVKVRVQKAGEE